MKTRMSCRLVTKNTVMIQFCAWGAYFTLGAPGMALNRGSLFGTGRLFPFLEMDPLFKP